MKRAKEFISKYPIILIIVGCTLILFAIHLVTTDRFVYNMDNFSYYASQQADTASKSYGNMAFSASYSSLSNMWGELYDEALRYLIIHGIGAVLSFSVGIAIFVQIWRSESKEQK